MDKIDLSISFVVYALIYLYCWFPLRTEIISSLRSFGSSQDDAPTCEKVATSIDAKAITMAMFSGTLKAIIIAFIIQCILYGVTALSSTMLPIDMKCYNAFDVGTVYKDGLTLSPLFRCDAGQESENPSPQHGGAPGFFENMKNKYDVQRAAASHNTDDTISRPGFLENMQNKYELKKALSSDTESSSKIHDFKAIFRKGKKYLEDKNAKRKPFQEHLSEAYTRSLARDHEDDDSDDLFKEASKFYTTIAYNIKFACIALICCAMFTYTYVRVVLPFIKCDINMLTVQAKIICLMNLLLYFAVLLYVTFTHGQSL